MRRHATTLTATGALRTPGGRAVPALLALLALPVLLAVGSLVVGPAAATPLAAQTIEGRVFEPEEGTPLPGVHLRLLGLEDRPVASTFSDDSGHFHIRAPGPGAWRLAADLLGYGSAVSDSIALSEDELVRVEIRMAVDPIRIDDPIVVVGEAPFVAPDIAEFNRRRDRGEKTGIGHFIYGEELERSIAGPPTDLLRMVPGVRVSRPGRGGGQVIHMRGGCVPAVYIDGSQINRFSRGESLDSYVDVFSIEGIEVYKGAQQPGGHFFDRSGCGLVLVWTRRGEYDGESPFSWIRLAAGVGLLMALFLLR